MSSETANKVQADRTATAWLDVQYSYQYYLCRTVQYRIYIIDINIS